MKFLRTSLRNLLASAFVALVLFVPLISLIPTQSKVYAANETFRWDNYNTISISGGDVAANAKMVSNPPFDNSFNGTTVYKGQCTLSLRMNVNPGAQSSGALTGIATPPVVTGPGQQAPPPGCAENIYSTYNRTITIAGNRQGQPETEAQKLATFSVGSGTSAAQAPGKITFTIKDKADKTVAGPRDVQQSPPPGDEDTPPGQRGAFYTTSFTLEPGDYRVCITGLLEDCYDFTKVKNEAFNKFYGEAFDSRQVNVEVEAKYRKPVADTVTAGPVDIILTREGGSPVTIQTDSATSGPRNFDERESISYEDITSTLRGAFSNIEPGKYKICVGGTTKCQNIEKKQGQILTVKFQISGDEVSAASLSGSEEDETSLCPDKLKEWVFSWAACPLVEGIQTAISEIRLWIYKQLLSDTSAIFGNGVNQTGYYRVWNSFRLLSVALIIISGIVMVASEALGFGVFKAYTIRKILPRLLVVAIIISLSWWIFEFIVQLFNNLTVWIYSAILSPFSLKVDPLDGAAVALQLLAVIVAAAVINPLVILSYAGTLLVAFLVASLIFAVRRIAIILLIVTSPAWLACYVLEGTKKIATVATGGAVSLLLMGLGFGLAQGSADAVMLTATDETDPFGIIRVGAAVAGVVAILIIFIKLGGMAATITGTLNDRSRGAFDRLKNLRGKEMSQNVTAMGEGTRWSGRNKLTRALNRTTSGATIAARTGVPYNPSDWRRRYTAGRAQSTQAVAAATMKNPKWGLIAQDDEALRAGTFSSHSAAIRGLTNRYMQLGQNEETAKRNAAAAVARFESTGLKIGNAGVRYAAAQGMVSTGTGYRDFGDMITTFADVAGKEKDSAAALSGWANFEAKQKGRNDWAPGAGTVISLTQQQMDFNNAAYDSIDSQGNKVYQGRTIRRVSQDQVNDAIIAGARGINAASVMGNKTASIENIVAAQSNRLQQVQTRLNTATSAEERSSAQQELARVTTDIQNMRDSGVYASSANVEALYGKAGVAPGRVPSQQILDTVQQDAQSKPTQVAETIIRTEDRPKPGGRPGETETVQVMSQVPRITPDAVINQRSNDANRDIRETVERFSNRPPGMR